MWLLESRPSQLLLINRIHQRTQSCRSRTPEFSFFKPLKFVGIFGYGLFVIEPISFISTETR